MLCYDVMELVGQEVSLCREVVQNKQRYDSVVSSMRDMCREAYDYGGQDPYSVEECHEEECHEEDYEPDDELCLDAGSYGTTFISDFKDCISNYSGRSLREQLTRDRSNLDVCRKWSRGWGRYYIYINDRSCYYWTRETEAIRLEIYGDLD